MDSFNLSDHLKETAIAIIGLSLRFPGADTPHAFFQNLKKGISSITFFTDEELLQNGIPSSLLTHPNYVKAKGILSNVAGFDADFFGFNPREAELMDVQHRLFLACAVECFENAGYVPDTDQGVIAVYASCGMSMYLLNNLIKGRSIHRDATAFQAAMLNDKDFLPTLTSYKLNLNGPSIGVQTACSSSLVAVHLACQSLLNGESDMALAGGVSIDIPQITGYIYEEGMIYSKDGHCRAFDAAATGTVGGNGCGLVLLKRLDDAVTDQDQILAIIRGSAVNNDGSFKVGYTAPSVNGQSQVIVEAQNISDVPPETISYVEAHGTGTPLGDPVEIEALTRAFRLGTQKNQFCALGSVKANIGHLNAAAGIAGLIKVVLGLKYRQLFPSPHFRTPNPNINFPATPFFVNTQSIPWASPYFPLRAGVSSFGIGGTNVHLIVEECPEGYERPEPRDASASSPRLFPLSARSPEALGRLMGKFADHIDTHPNLNLRDMAYTLQLGRKPYAYRRAILARTVGELKTGLVSEAADSKPQTPSQRGIVIENPAVVFMFPGQGSQYVNMGRQLYETESVFRFWIDRCADILFPHLRMDIKSILYPTPSSMDVAAEKLLQTQLTQPALFTVEYALARVFMDWGIRPEVMIGHSIGEYVAACLAEVFPLEAALPLIAIRARLIQALPPGDMLAVFLPLADISSLISPQLSVAALNSPHQTVISGDPKEIQEVAIAFERLNIPFQKLKTSHAFHSQMMNPMLAEFSDYLSAMTLNAPSIPFISNATGDFITAVDATNPQYWMDHLRNTVRFSTGIQTLFKQTHRLFLEIGAGQTLTLLARDHDQAPPRAHFITTLPPTASAAADRDTLLSAAGKLWTLGCPLDWGKPYTSPRPRRIALPTYPFDDTPYWIEPESSEADVPQPSGTLTKRPHIEDWIYIPTWQRRACAFMPLVNGKEKCILFTGTTDFRQSIAEQLHLPSFETYFVQKGLTFERSAHHVFTMNYDQKEDYQTLLNHLNLSAEMPVRVIDMRPLETDSPTDTTECGQLIFLAQALLANRMTGPVRLSVLTAGGFDVTGSEPKLLPLKAALLGPVRVIPQEMPNIFCQNIDLPFGLTKRQHSTDPALMTLLAAELMSADTDPIVTLRPPHRWVQVFDPLPHFPLPDAASTLLKREGVYLITGGLGAIGMRFAQFLAQHYGARLVLTGRTPLPPRNDWETLPAPHPDAALIQALLQLESYGAKVLTSATDVADETGMRDLAALTENRFGPINGIVHAAGYTGISAVAPLENLAPPLLQQHFHPKIDGLRVLEKVFKDKSLDFCLLMSSLSSLVGGLGFAAYSAANNFLDAFAQANARLPQNFPVMSINWDGWRLDPLTEQQGVLMPSSASTLGLTPDEGVKVFQRLLHPQLQKFPQIIVSTGDINDLQQKWQTDMIGAQKHAAQDSPSVFHQRPDLAPPFVSPAHPIEREIIDVFQEILGIAPIGAQDNFFELGGNSLLATRVVSKLIQTLDTSVSLERFFKDPTPRGILSQLAPTDQAPIDPAPINPADTDPDLLNDLLTQVESMSEEDARRLLEIDGPLLSPSPPKKTAP